MSHSRVSSARFPFPVVIVSVLLLCSMVRALADESFVIVPAPGKVVVDGKSNDWDLSGAYGPVSFDAEFLGRYDATFYGMYDKEKLYLFFHVHDATPLVNKGIIEEGNYWWGDSLEVRFSLNPKDGVPPKQESQDIRHFAIWYNSERQKPQYYIKASMKYQDWSTDGMQVVFQKWPNNDGWDCEVGVPWTTLSKTVRPQPGDYIGWCMAILYGNESGLQFWRKANVMSGDINYQNTGEWHSPGAYLSPVGHVAPNPKTRTRPTGIIAAPPVTQIKYTLPRTGKVSLAIYNPAGRMVRTLLCYEAQAAGAHQVDWDGYDDDGKPLPPGEYRWKLAVGDGVQAVYRMGLLNDGDPKYRVADGKGSWGGIWGNVIDTAADNTGVYLLWIMEEGEGVLVKIDTEGRVLWKQHIPQALASEQSCLAADGTHVVVGSVRGIWRASAATGEYEPFTPKPYIFIDASKAWQALKPEERRQQVPELNRLPSLGGGNFHITGIELDGNRIIISRLLDNAVQVYDMVTGEKVQEVAVPRPFSLALHDGLLYVVSGTQVLRYDAKTLEAKGAAIEKGLVAPFGLDVDRWGNFWVTDEGTSQQVKKFAPDGKLLAAYGPEGGRSLAGGAFNKREYRYPTGISIEPRSGMVFFGEDVAPKRVVALDSAGRFVREWVGPYYWGGAAFGFDGQHSPQQFYACSGGSVMRYNIDLDEGTSTLDAVWPDRSIPGPDGKPALTSGSNCAALKYHDGKPYLIAGLAAVSIYRIDGYRLIPSAYISHPTWPENKGIIWRDANGNGIADPEEIQKGDFKVPFYGDYWGPSIDDNFNLVTIKDTGVTQLRCTGFDAVGNPIYTFDNIEQLVGKLPLESSDPIGHVDAEGNIYYNRWTYAKPGQQPKGIDWAARITDTGIVKLNAKGEPLWQAFRKAESFRKPYEAYAICSLQPPTKGFLFADDCVGGQTYVVDNDGLVLGAMLEETTRGPAPGAYTLYVEHFTSYPFVDPRDGQVYFATGSDDIRLFRVVGLDSYQRLEGKVAFTEQPKPRVAPGTAEAKLAHAARLTAAPKIDGSLAEWKDVPSQALAVGKPGEEMSASYQIGYDAKNLYAAFHVVDASPMINSGKVLDSLFKYGDALDLYLACDATADPARKAPVPGDVRLLLTKYQGKPIVVVYRAKVPGTKNPATFTSAVGKYIIDVVEPLKEAQLVFKTDADGKGYTAELAVPLTALAPLKPSAGLKIGFDAGVVFSDTAGQFNAAKAYWTGREAMARDIPTEASFFQDKWGSLEF